MEKLQACRLCKGRVCTRTTFESGITVSGRKILNLRACIHQNCKKFHFQTSRSVSKRSPKVQKARDASRFLREQGLCFVDHQDNQFLGAINQGVLRSFTLLEIPDSMMPLAGKERLIQRIVGSRNWKHACCSNVTLT